MLPEAETAVFELEQLADRTPCCCQQLPQHSTAAPWRELRHMM
jgi:hypothetical protein